MYVCSTVFFGVMGQFYIVWDWVLGGSAAPSHCVSSATPLRCVSSVAPLRCVSSAAPLRCVGSAAPLLLWARLRHCCVGSALPSRGWGGEKYAICITFFGGDGVRLG